MYITVIKEAAHGAWAAIVQRVERSQLSKEQPSQNFEYKINEKDSGLTLIEFPLGTIDRLSYTDKDEERE